MKIQWPSDSFQREGFLSERWMCTSLMAVQCLAWCSAHTRAEAAPAIAHPLVACSNSGLDVQHRLDGERKLQFYRDPQCNPINKGLDIAVSSS